MITYPVLAAIVSLVSSSSEVQRSGGSSSNGYGDSFYYGSKSVKHDTPSLYNANNNYDTDIGELNSS